MVLRHKCGASLPEVIYQPSSLCRQQLATSSKKECFFCFFFLVFLVSWAEVPHRNLHAINFFRHDNPEVEKHVCRLSLISLFAGTISFRIFRKAAPTVQTKLHPLCKQSEQEFPSTCHIRIFSVRNKVWFETVPFQNKIWIDFLLVWWKWCTRRRCHSGSFQTSQLYMLLGFKISIQ